MNFEEFKTEFIIQLDKININLTEEQYLKFYKYMDLIIEWNKKMNLTAIVEPSEIITKHFIDSLTVVKYIEDSKKIIDVGTGAGFPGIPIKILKSDTKITLLDSLNKRLIFLNEVIRILDLKNIETVHYRAEEAGSNNKYREQYDIAISRAVAPLNVLLEYTIPFIKVNGKCIYMKSNKIEDEIKDSKNAINKLYSKIERKENFNLPNTDINRTIVILKKEKETAQEYPRKAGTPSKLPL